MKKIIRLLPLLLLVFMVSDLHPARAQVASPTPFQLIEAFYYQHVLEDDDFLVMMRYDLGADGAAGGGDWDDFTGNDAFLDLDTETGTTVQTTQPPDIGPGLVAFYLDAADFAATSIDLTVSPGPEDEPTARLYSSPTTFTPNQSEGPFTITSDTGANIDASRAALGARVLDLVNSIERENLEDATDDPFHFDPAELVSAGGLLTAVGDDFAIAAFAPLPLIVPNIFENSTSVLGEDFGTAFISVLTANAASGQADVVVRDASVFSTGLSVLLRDSNSEEVLEIQSINSTTNTVTMTANLVNSYTTAAIAVLVATGLITSLEPQSGERATNSALEGFATSLGLSNWAGGMLFVATFGIALLIATGIASGSFVLGAAALPLVMIVAALAGWIPLNAVIIIAVIVILLATLWVVRTVPS